MRKVIKLDYSKYYTPPGIAATLIEQLNMDPPESAIDICCGSCNLLYAAKNRWSHIDLIGVDIVDHSSQDVVFTTMDGREYATKHRHKYPLVLANPPFDKLEDRSTASELYQGCFKYFNTGRLEVEMLIANLALLADGGKLLIIMPNTFVEGARNKRIRKVIGENFRVELILRLPDDAFGTVGIKSYSLVISHKAGQYYQTIHSVVSRKNDGTDFQINEIEKVGAERIIDGDWVEENKRNNPDIEIRRGNISSHYFSDKGTAVLHTSKSLEQWNPGVRYVSEMPQRPVYAEYGDIVISRIGKSAGEWCVYYGESMPITDCLFCLKNPSQDLINKIEGKKFDRRLRGVATRYITKNDFVSWAYTQDY